MHILRSTKPIAVTFATLLAFAGCSQQANDPSPVVKVAAASHKQQGSKQTVLTQNSGGSITDSSGNVWTLTSSGDVQENGSSVAGGGGTSELTYVASTQTIWGQDASSGQWYSWNGNGWDGPSSTSPVSASSSPPPSTPPANSPPPSTPPPSAPPPSTPPSGKGNFYVSGGKIIDPSGNVFLAKGINSGSDANPSDILNAFPGITFVRLAVGGLPSASSLQGFVTTLTNAHVVVEIENHPWPLENAQSGDGLTQETDWYASQASAFKGNPYVWFGTQNEPQGGDMASEHLATYQAIRNTGSETVVMMVAGIGGGNPGTVGPNNLDPSKYTGMHSVVWDYHFYGWIDNFDTNQDTVNSYLLGTARSDTGVQAAQLITSADGKIPVINGEFGPSTSGQSSDANASQVEYAVAYWGVNNGYTSGFAGWHWNADAYNAVQQNGSLTSWGQSLLQAIQASR